MITKKITKRENLSNDKVHQAIVNQFSGRYSIIRQSKNKIKIKRLYNFQSDGWEVIVKQINLKDTGCFKIDKNFISFTSSVSKPLIFWSLLSILFFFILLNLFRVPFTVSLFTITTPLIAGWTKGFYSLKNFQSHELNMISKRLKS
jgi:hypothetical protein